MPNPTERRAPAIADLAEHLDAADRDLAAAAEQLDQAIARARLDAPMPAVLAGYDLTENAVAELLAGAIDTSRLHWRELWQAALAFDEGRRAAENAQGVPALRAACDRLDERFDALAAAVLATPARSPAEAAVKLATAHRFRDYDGQHQIQADRALSALSNELKAMA